MGFRSSCSFLDTYTNGSDAKKTAGEKAEEQDAEILAAIANRRILASDMELAKGISYTEPLKTSFVTFCTRVPVALTVVH